MKTQIIDVSTGKEIVREMTQDELAQREKDLQEFEAAIVANQTKLEAKAAAQAKLAALGLTTDDLKALGL